MKLSGMWVNGKTEEASLHAELAFKYDPMPDGKSSNNLGYFFMATGQNERAEQMLRRAIEILQEDSETKALATYNLAVLMAKLGKKDTALQLLQECSQTIGGLSDDEKSVACLLVPQLQDGHLTFPEVSHPMLDKACADAISAIRM